MTPLEKGHVMCKAGHKQTPPVILNRAPGLCFAQCVKDLHPLHQCHNTQYFITMNWCDFQRVSPNSQPCLVEFFFLQCILGVNVAQGTSFANAIPASIFEIVLKYIYFLFKISSPSWNDASHLKWTFASRTAGVDPVVPPYYWAAGSASLHWKPVWLQVSREGMQKQGWPNSPSLLLIAFRKDQNELRMERFLLLLLASAKSVFMPHCKASPSSCSRSCWKPRRKDILN